MAYVAKEAHKESDAGNPATEKAEETISWLDEHPDEDKVAYDEKREELEKVMREAGPPPGQAPCAPCEGGVCQPPMPESDEGPQIEEID